MKMNRTTIGSLPFFSLTCSLLFVASVQAAHLTIRDDVEGQVTLEHDANWEFGVTSNGTAFGDREDGTTTVPGEMGSFTGTWTTLGAAGNPDPGSGIVYILDPCNTTRVRATIQATWATGDFTSTITLNIQSSPACGDGLAPLPAAFAGLGIPASGCIGIAGSFRDPVTAAPVSIPGFLSMAYCGSGPCGGGPCSACCFSDGSCTSESCESCDAAGGAPQAAGTTCEATLCPGESGACCRVDGGCGPSNIGFCQSLGGTYLGDGTTCEATLCPGESGACCRLDGSCGPTNIGFCQEVGGTYLGDGTDCDTTTCPGESGACCRPGGGCGESNIGNCQSNGGTYQGDGTFCDFTFCPGSGGACCRLDGGCGPSTIGFCQSVGGSYRGDLTTCGSTTCPGQSGACCRSEGACGPTNIGFCQEVGGTYQGDGTTCDTTTCPTASGACCYPDGDCSVAARAVCDAAGGTYQGDATTCPSPNTCPGARGACCFSDGDCLELTRGVCATNGGTYQTDGTTCAATTCDGSGGACCFSDGDCLELTIGVCDANNGTYQTDGSTCAAATCDGSGGACCFLDGDCLELTTGVCVNNGGTYRGDDTTCAATACPGSDGACCFLDGDCLELTTGVCVNNGGTYRGDDTTCDPNTCPGSGGACCFPDGSCCPQTTGSCTASGGTHQGDDSTCDPNLCPQPPGGACCLDDCGCVEVTREECATLAGAFRGDGTSCDDPFGDTPPVLTCPDPITLESGDRTECGSPEALDAFLGGAVLTGGTCDPEITTNAPECGFPPGTTTVTFTAIDCGRIFTCQSTVTVATNRIDSTQKGSLLIFSKIEIKWDAQGNVIQDTFLDFANDADVDGVEVQAYFINGDKTREEITLEDGTVTQEAEPGWNSMDCRFHLTKTQPHYWSAARGSSLCQPFTALDDEGPGRPDPENPGGRVLRGFAVMWAVDFNEDGNYWEEIRWNHLKGDALLVNYALGSAWEYNAYAAQTRCVAQGEAPLDCLITDENGTCCEAGVIPGRLDLDGFQYDAAFDQLLLDFYASGSTAFSATRADGSPGVGVMLDTDLTLHPLDIDLRQDGVGPILTKAEFEVFNQNEIKLSGLRKCICCWDQTMVSNYVSNVNVPNYFLRQRLGTDKGYARIDAVRTVQEECDYCEVCGIEPRIGRTPAASSSGSEGDTAGGLPDFIDVCEINMTRDTALLGLSAKLLSFEDGLVKQEWAGMNLPGVGVQTAEIELEDNGKGGVAGHPPVVVLHRGATIQYDIQRGTDESHDAAQIPVRQPRAGKSAGQSESIRKSGR